MAFRRDEAGDVVVRDLRRRCTPPHGTSGAWFVVVIVAAAGSHPASALPVVPESCPASATPVPGSRGRHRRRRSRSRAPRPRRRSRNRIPRRARAPRPGRARNRGRSRRRSPSGAVFRRGSVVARRPRRRLEGAKKSSLRAGLSPRRPPARPRGTGGGRRPSRWSRLLPSRIRPPAPRCRRRRHCDGRILGTHRASAQQCAHPRDLAISSETIQTLRRH